MEETIKDIRLRLRQAMNGIVSASMRQKGVEYKLNFGVAIPEIKKIAANYKPDKELAKWLWSQDVREHKILSTLLYPHEAFTKEEAESWAGDIRHQEIAELLCINLLQHLAFAKELAEEWISDDREYVKVCGFLLYVRLYKQGNTTLSADHLLAEAKQVIDSGISQPQRAAVLALKQYGRQGKTATKTVLDSFNEYQHSESNVKQEIYNDLKFEFEYYQ